MARTAAFFDFDKTLLKKDTGEQILRWAVKTKNIGTWFAIMAALCGKLYHLNLMSARKVSDLAYTYFTGRPLAQFTDGLEDFYREWLEPYLCPLMLERLAEHREQGCTSVILSAAPKYMLDYVGRRLGFEVVLATRLEVDDRGICTGRTVDRILGEEKVAAAMDLAKRANINMEASYAYSDHHSDLGLLQAVGHPVAVRPTKQLLAAARQYGWPIIGH